MKKLTKGQRFALAREARRLAMECVEGTAPEFGDNGYSDCALGYLGQRYGKTKKRDGAVGASLCGTTFFDHWIFVAYLNDEFDDPSDRHAAVVFPLLALADALEASAASLRQAPPEVP